jgi:hypothetical protein
VTLGVLGGYYFLFYNDALNLPWGERYLLPFVPLTVVPVAAALEAGVGRKDWIRWPAIVLVAALVASQALRVWGVAPSRFQLGQGDLLGMSGVTPLSAMLASYYELERQGRFLVRRWITGNVEPGASIYVERYLNVQKASDRSDLRVGRVFDSDKVNLPNLRGWRPQYVFTKDRVVVSAIEASEPYRTVAVLGLPGSQVFVLRRREAGRTE